MNEELKKLHAAMLAGQQEKGRTLTLREMARRLGRLPADNYVSATRGQVRKLCDMEAVKEHQDIRDRKYEAIPYVFD